MSLTNDEAERLTECLAALGEARARLYPRARDFIDDLEHRFEAEGADLHVSAPMWRWIEDLMGQFAS